MKEKQDMKKRNIIKGISCTCNGSNDRLLLI